jgi:DNA modification methylase
MTPYHNKLLLGDCRQHLPTLPDALVDCVVTSIPYWGLRNYDDHPDQIGLEPSPEEFVATIVAVFDQVARVMKPTGTCWLNIGDSYWGGKGQNGNTKARTTAADRGYKQPLGTPIMANRPADGKHPILKPKDKMLMPFRVALALQEAGWWVRQDIIWHKLNPMPESVNDRPTTGHEYLFLLTRVGSGYFYDARAIQEPCSDNTHAHARASKAMIRQFQTRKGIDTKGGNQGSGRMPTVATPKTQLGDAQMGVRNTSSFAEGTLGPVHFRNKRSVWSVSSKGIQEAHFATFPPALILPCILAGCPTGGLVLDPFMGSGTTAIVARSNGRHYLGIELTEPSMAIAKRRIERELGILNLID